MKRYLILFLGLVLIPLSVWAQDPGNPDTVYWEASGLHSGDTLYVSPAGFPDDVSVNLMVWTDNGIAGLSFPFKDDCYNSVSMPTYIDPNKNDPDSTEDHCFVGSLIEDFSIVSLNVYGSSPTPSPPHFLVGAVSFTDSFYQPGMLAHLIFTVGAEGCICPDTTIGGPGMDFWYPVFTTPYAVTYYTTTVRKCFEVREMPFLCGDVNTDLQLNLSDAIFLANYIFKGGATPARFSVADVDCNDVLNVSDIIILAKFIFGMPGFELCCM